MVLENKNIEKKTDIISQQNLIDSIEKRLMESGMDTYFVIMSLVEAGMLKNVAIEEVDKVVELIRTREHKNGFKKIIFGIILLLLGIYAFLMEVVNLKRIPTISVGITVFGIYLISKGRKKYSDY